MLVLDYTVVDAALTDDDGMGDADELHVGEHHARTLLAVIEQHVDPGGLQLAVEAFGQLGHAMGLVHVHRDDHHLKRRDGIRPDDAGIVIVLLDGGGDHAGDADAVAAHLHDGGLAFLVQHRGLHRLGVLGAELEDVAHFDAALEQQGALATGAWVAFHHVADVGHFVVTDIAIPVGTGQMLAGFVGATDKVGQMGSAAIDDDATGEADRADGAGITTGGRLDLFVIGKGQRLGDARQLLGLHLVELVIATQHQGDDRLLLLLVFFAQHQQSLGDLTRRHGEEGGDLVDGVNVRGVDRGQRGAGGRACASRCHSLGHLDVGGVIRIGGEGDQIFTALGQHLELVGAGAADGAGIGLHRAEVQTHAAEGGAVGGVHLAVGVDQAGLVDMEGVGVLHQEFTAAHHAETGTHFVAELGLDLVEVQRQLLVAIDLVANQVGDHLFVGRAQHEGAVVAVGQTAQLGTILLPAAGFLPQLGRLHHGHRDFDGAGAVHLFPDDILDLLQDAQAGGQPVVEAGGQFTDHAGAQHQLVADHLGVGGSFLEGREQILAGTHEFGTFLGRSCLGGMAKSVGRNSSRLPGRT